MRGSATISAGCAHITLKFSDEICTASKAYHDLLPYIQAYNMVKPLSFKGEKKSRKRKAPDLEPTKADPSAPVSLVSASDAIEAVQDDSWVTAEAPTDIIGPVIFALPSQPATCIACDANGKVFAYELENIVEGDLRTAEPHDIRQVWVASKVAGTESISFKGHHGRYEYHLSLSLSPPIRADLLRAGGSILPDFLFVIILAT